MFTWIIVSEVFPKERGRQQSVLSTNPNLTPRELKATILSNTTSCPALSGKCVTGGRLNAVNALTNVQHFAVYSYTATSSMQSHTAHCSECGTSFSEPHSWVFNPATGKYRCSKCLKTSPVIPSVTGNGSVE